MPTCARKYQLDLSLIYHIYNRSNSRIPIFKSEEDFMGFIGLLRKYPLRFGLKIYHEGNLFHNLERPAGDKEFLRRLIKENSRFTSRRRGRPSERIIV